MARGRPVGWRKKGGVRTLRTLKAYDDEWEIIRRLAKIVKHGDKEKIVKLLDEIEQDSTRVERGDSMRPIKFRGKRKFNGEIVFGDLTHSRTGKAVYIEDDQVDPESAAQLVGYDADGNEFYDDDILIDSFGAEVAVKDLIINYSEIGSKFEFYKLKK